MRNDTMVWVSVRLQLDAIRGRYGREIGTVIGFVDGLRKG